MYGKPSHSPAVPIVTVVIVVVLFGLYTIGAIFLTQTALRCGPACSVLMGAVHP